MVHLISCSEGIMVCPGIKRLGREADHVCLVPRLRMSGFIPPPSRVPSLHAQERLLHGSRGACRCRWN